MSANVSCTADSVAAIAIKKTDDGYNVVIRYKNCPEFDVCSVHSTFDEAEDFAGVYRVEIQKALDRNRAYEKYLLLTKVTASKQTQTRFSDFQTIKN